MRRPRDIDAELMVLNDGARTLKDRKVRQLGELVIVTGADALDIDTLAGGPLAVVTETRADRKAVMHEGGVAFFQGNGHRKTGDRTETN